MARRNFPIAQILDFIAFALGQPPLAAADQPSGRSDQTIRTLRKAGWQLGETSMHVVPWTGDVEKRHSARLAPKMPSKPACSYNGGASFSNSQRETKWSSVLQCRRSMFSLFERVLKG